MTKNLYNQLTARHGKARVDRLIAIVGEDQAAEILSGAEQESKAIEDMGVAYKGATGRQRQAAYDASQRESQLAAKAAKTQRRKELTPAEINRLLDIIDRMEFNSRFNWKEIRQLLISYGVDATEALMDTLQSAKARRDAAKWDPFWMQADLKVPRPSTITRRDVEKALNVRYDEFWARVNLKVPVRGR